MKKLLCLIILFFGSCAFANDLCVTTYDLTSAWSQFLSRASGSNYIHKTILERYLEKEAQKYLGGKINIKIDSFSTNDLKAGKFKSLKGTGENLTLDKLTISKVTLESLCSYNRLEKLDNNYQFATDFPADLTLEFSTDDLNQITQTKDYKKVIKNINDTLLGLLRIENVNFEVKENKLWYDLIFSTPFSPKKQTVSVGTTLNLNNGDIEVNRADAKGKSSILNLISMSDALNFINPLDFSTKILENKNIDADIKEAYVSGDKVVIKAFVNIRK